MNCINPQATGTNQIYKRVRFLIGIIYVFESTLNKHESAYRIKYNSQREIIAQRVNLALDHRQNSRAGKGDEYSDSAKDYKNLFALDFKSAQIPAQNERSGEQRL